MREIVHKVKDEEKMKHKIEKVKTENWEKRKYEMIKPHFKSEYSRIKKLINKIQLYIFKNWLNKWHKIIKNKSVANNSQSKREEIKGSTMSFIKIRITSKTF